MGTLKLRKQKSEKGQGFMEMAISLTFLLVLLTVLIDLGYAFYTLIAMRDAIQEAAAYGSMCPPNTADDVLKIENRLKKSAYTPLNIEDITNINIRVVDPNGVDAPIEKGNSVQISLTADHQIIVPFVATFLGTDRYPLTVTVADTILRTTNKGCN